MPTDVYIYVDKIHVFKMYFYFLMGGETDLGKTRRAVS